MDLRPDVAALATRRYQVIITNSPKESLPSPPLLARQEIKMPSTEAAGQPSPDSEPPVKSQRSFILYLVLCAVLVVLVVAVWLGYRARRGAAQVAAAQVAAENLRKQNVLISGSPANAASLMNRQINQDLVQDLSKLVHLKTLNLSGTGTTDDQLAEIVQNLNLVSLVLNNTAVTDEGLGAILHLSRLETLMLPDTNIGDAGLAVIGKMKKLTELNLSRTQISDDGLKALAGLPNLVRLILDGTKITDQGVVHLASIPELKVLEIRETSITPEGIRNFNQLKKGVDVKR